MKKLLLVSDGIAFPEGAFRFACGLNEREPLLLTGVFMPQVSYSHLWSYTHALGGPAIPPFMDAGDDEIIEKNIHHFENLCRQNNIAFVVHKDYAAFALPELRDETLYADALLLDSECLYQHILGQNATTYITNVLREAECPVLVVPENFDFPLSNVIAYDGSVSSLYAIKQFTYLFPALCRQQTTVLYLHKADDVKLPHEAELKELMQHHFPQVTFLKAGPPSNETLRKWLFEQTAPLFIAGAFNRSVVSQVFHKSFLRDVIAWHKLPVFIAHK